MMKESLTQAMSSQMKMPKTQATLFTEQPMQLKLHRRKKHIKPGRKKCQPGEKNGILTILFHITLALVYFIHLTPSR
jgi:hypothetical protein